MAGVEKERRGYQSNRDRDQNPRIYAIRICATHKPNENKISYAFRRRG
jgi:hypothetical protein